MTHLSTSSGADRRFASLPRSHEQIELTARIVGRLMAPDDESEAERVTERFIALQRWRGLTK